MRREGLENRMESPEKLLGSSFRCECGKEHVVPVRRMVIEEEAYRRLPEVLEELSLPREACVVADENTFEVLGRKVARLLSERKYAVQEEILRSPPGKTVKADQPTADALLSSLPGVPLLIAVGSGTINDLTKLAAYRRGIPYVVLATAASMNGYTSSIVALTVSGLKTTSEANPPVAVIADMNVLVEAPMELIVSGLGDLVSKPVSTADWKLAEMVEGEYFCYRPIQIVEAFEPGYMNRPEGIRLRRPEAIRALTEGLLYSGISMVIAGTSSPGSGGEHLISHTLDMQADLAGREHGYHGSQVGVATIFSAALYERLLREDIASFDIEALASSEEESVQRRFSSLREYWGPFAEVVGEEFSCKLRGPRSREERLIAIREKWAEIKRELARFLRPWGEIRDVLRRAEAPARIADISVSVEEFRAAVLHAREMRRRYTVLDLADDFGLLQKHLDSIIAETGLAAE
jgi:glycerol-1-phosphate dehydrogenase [NAD(P)+]